jgi:hypothetical protein
MSVMSARTMRWASKTTRRKGFGARIHLYHGLEKTRCAARRRSQSRQPVLAAIADALRWLPSALIAGGLTEPLGATEAQRRSNYGE